MDVVGFLTARLDEDEQVAREATPSPWTVYTIDYSSDIAGVTSSREGGTLSIDDGEHIARHDPARVLADVAAKRAILDAHQPAPHSAPTTADPTCQICCDGPYYEAAWLTYPCPTALALASVYADHPDFDPAWKVET